MLKGHFGGRERTEFDIPRSGARAVFFDTNLVGADFTGADLRDVRLAGPAEVAKFVDTNLTNVLFEKSVAEDSSYALAYAGLAEAAFRKYSITEDPRWVNEVEKFSASQLVEEMIW